MKQQPKHEKIKIPKGRILIFKKVVANLKKEDKEFKKLMGSLPPIQKLATHSYCYVPFKYARRLFDDNRELHYEVYGYCD